MLNSRDILVNRRFYKGLFFLGLMWISGCGFQLNRNQVSLPNNAQSMALSISNSTYTAGLNLELSRELSRVLSANNIKVSPGSTADLLLHIDLTGSNYTREDLSIQNNQSYRFHFSQNAVLHLKDQRDNKWIYQSIPLIGSYDFQTTATELGTEDLRDSGTKALSDLAQKISTQLSQNF